MKRSVIDILDLSAQELEELIAGKRATWEPGTLRHTSWTGAELVYEPAHDPWKISKIFNTFALLI